MLQKERKSVSEQEWPANTKLKLDLFPNPMSLSINEHLSRNFITVSERRTMCTSC